MLPPGSAGVPPAQWRGGPTRHFRGYLPHYSQPGLLQTITFRLADALPAEALEKVREESKGRDAAQRQRLEDFLDAGHGACHLKNPHVAHLVETALHHFGELIEKGVENSSAVELTRP